MSVLTVGVLLFVGLSAMLFAKLYLVHQERRRAREEAARPVDVPQELRDATRNLANETTKLKAAVRQMTSKPDPFRELVRTMTDQRRRDHPT